MSDYKAVRSTVEISRRIACYLDMFDPQYFNGMSQARAVRNINDILQGRSEWTVETLLGELRQKGPALAVKAEQISQEIQDFQAQRELLKKPYKRFSDIEYDYKMHDDGSPYPLKMIDQRLYDQAAQDGFPPRFLGNLILIMLPFTVYPMLPTCTAPSFTAAPLPFAGSTAQTSKAPVFTILHSIPVESKTFFSQRHPCAYSF